MTPPTRCEEYKDKTESEWLRDFMLRAPAYRADLPAKNEYRKWLELAQHYRLPTRLLDWSESMLVAAYFATEEAEKYPTVAIWAMDYTTLNEKAVIEKFNIRNTQGQMNIWQMSSLIDYFVIKMVFGITKSIDQHTNNLCNQVDAFENKPYRNLTDKLSVFPFAAEWFDSRMSAQKSWFTMHGNDSYTEKTEPLESCCKKLVLADPKAIRKELQDVGIDEAFIYPNLEHLGLSLKSKFERYNQQESP